MKQKNRATSTLTIALAVACLLAMEQASAQGLAQPEKRVEEIVAGMVKAQAQARAQFRAYIATRKYQVFHEDEAQPKSEMEVSISFLPPSEKSFKVERSTGGMAERVVRKALEKEVEITRDPQVSAMTPDNYKFEIQGRESVDGHDCYVLGIQPAREGKELLEGRIWVDSALMLVRRIEGSPAKSPSWWVKHVDLVLTYGSVKGMWLQTGSVANAHVRMAGDYRMVAHDIDVQTASYVSEEVPPTRPRQAPRARTRRVPLLATNINP